MTSARTAAADRAYLRTITPEQEQAARRRFIDITGALFLQIRPSAQVVDILVSLLRDCLPDLAAVTDRNWITLRTLAEQLVTAPPSHRATRLTALQRALGDFFLTRVDGGLR